MASRGYAAGQVLGEISQNDSKEANQARVPRFLKIPKLNKGSVRKYISKGKYESECLSCKNVQKTSEVTGLVKHVRRCRAMFYASNCDIERVFRPLIKDYFLNDSSKVKNMD